jgi:ATP-dependent protease ClpP protease subunit
MRRGKKQRRWLGPKAGKPKNGDGRSWYSIQGKKDDSVEILIYDEIGFWGITAKAFVKELKSYGDVKHIHLKINSPGGSVFDGTAIYNELVNHKATITAAIDGVAASMASIIAMSAERVTMPKNTFLFIHNPFVLMAGDAAALRKEANLLDQMKESGIEAYRRHARKLSAEEISKLMDEETWLSGEEAKEQGFIEEVTEAKELEDEEEVNFGEHSVPANVYSTLLGIPDESQVPEDSFSGFQRFQRRTAAADGDTTAVSVFGMKKGETKWTALYNGNPRSTSANLFPAPTAVIPTAVQMALSLPNNTASPKGGKKMHFDTNGNLVDENGMIVMTAEQVKEQMKGFTDPHQREVEEAKLLEGRKAEYARQTGIRAMIAEFNLTDDEAFVAELIGDGEQKEGLSIEDARVKVMAKVSQMLRDGVVRPKAGGDGVDKKRSGMTNALLCQSGIIKNSELRTKMLAGNEYRGNSLQGIVRHCLSTELGNRAFTMPMGSLATHAINHLCEHGQTQIADLDSFFDMAGDIATRVTTEQGFGEREAEKAIVETMIQALSNPQMAMGMNSSDLLSVLSNVNSISLLKGYAMVPRTYPLVSSPGTFNDLKSAELYKQSEGPDVLEIPEGQAPKLGQMSDAKETAQLAKYGRAYSITEKMIIDDRLDLMASLPEKWGRSIPREINWQFWNNMLVTNPTLLETGRALFNTTDGNLAAAAAAISLTSLGAATTAFMNYTILSPDDSRSKAQRLSVTPRYLACGPGSAMNANRYTGSEYVPAATNEETNIFGPRGQWRLTPVIEPLVDSLTSSTPWILMADPADLDYAKVITLAGRETPRTSSRVGGAGEVKGIIFDVEHYWVVKFVDWRGMYQTP